MLTSADNQRVKAIRRLRRSKGAAEGKLLIEGPHLLAAALDAGLKVFDVLASPDLMSSSPSVLDRLEMPPTVVAPSLLERMADADSPRGLVAIVAEPDWHSSPAQLAARLERAGRPLVLADRLQDPGNLGALARTIDAAGAAGLLLTAGCASPGHPRALRASAGSLLRVPVVRNVDWRSLAQDLGEDRLWVALVPGGDSASGNDLYATQLTDDPLLCLGSEGSGLDPEIAAHCQRTVSIPVERGVESLNATVAVALVLFELRRRALSQASTAPR